MGLPPVITVNLNIRARGTSEETYVRYRRGIAMQDAAPGIIDNVEVMTMSIAVTGAGQNPAIKENRHNRPAANGNGKRGGIGGSKPAGKGKGKGSGITRSGRVTK